MTYIPSATFFFRLPDSASSSASSRSSSAWKRGKFFRIVIIIIMVELYIPYSMSQDFGGAASSGATHGDGGRRLDGESLKPNGLQDLVVSNS